MTPFLTIIKSDYLQRTRSYPFLITLCTSLAIAYTFVPEPNANYSTIRIANHVGYYNSSWFGYVTAIMTSVFLSLIGFYLINSGIKKDVNTKVGQIIAATSISNFKYLLAKALSNFMLLMTIVTVVFVMSIMLFILYNDGYPFELFQFIKPYALITIPSMFVISVIAVTFEVFVGKYSVIQNIGFFFLFSILAFNTPKADIDFLVDVFGTKLVMHDLERTVKKITNSEKDADLSIGYVVGNTEQTKKFEFNGIDFPASYIMSRVIWMLFGIALIIMISRFFHRFDRKERVSKKKSMTTIDLKNSAKDILLSSLPTAQINYSIFPLLKTEILLLFRKGKRWLWLFNLIGMVLLAMLPIKIAHQMVLPILWFFQVSRISDVTTKETTNNIHYYAFTAFKPIGRLLMSQLLAAFFIMLLLASPLVFRLSFQLNYSEVLAVGLGAIFIVLLAAVLGIISKGKKLFEVLFFMIAYANINSIPFVDYFGGFVHHTNYLIWLGTTIIILYCSCILIRANQLNQ